MYRKNSKYSKNNKFSKDCKLNCSKTLLQIFVALLEKIGLIEIACRNLVCKSAKIAKVTTNFIAPKNTQITIARIARITTYIYSKQIRLIKEKGIEGPKKEVGKFRKKRKTNKNILIFYCNNKNNIKR